MSERRLWPVRVVVLLAILGLLLAVVPPAVESAPSLPHVEVVVTAPDPVTIGPVDYKHIPVQAAVSYGGFRQGTTINVNASTDNYWTIEVVPSSHVVGSNLQEETFSVTIDVRVPPKASAERPATLTVEAVAVTPPPLPSINYTGFDTCQVRVRQYFGLRLDSNHTASVDQGTNRWRVTNTGNGADNFTVELTNAQELHGKGLTLTYNNRLSNIGQDRAETVTVGITANATATVDIVVAYFKVTSVGDASQTDVYSLTIIVREAEPTDGGNGGGDKKDENSSPGLGAMAALAAFLGAGAALADRRKRRA
jgi:hypothetical protein